MKYLANICLAGLAVLSIAACSHVAQYTGEDFVAFKGTSVSVNESVGSVKIPMMAYPQDGNPNTTVSFKVIENTAKAGTDFTVEPASGVLTFAGDSTQYITVNVNNFAGIYTGDKKFQIQIASTTNDYTFPNYNTVNFTIKDEDHPLSAILGTYTAQGIEDYWGDVYNFEITVVPVDGDITKVQINNLDPYFAEYGFTSDKGVNYVIGQVNEDKTSITIPNNQAMGYGTCFFAALEADAITISIGSNTLTFDDWWGVNSADGWWCLYPSFAVTK